MLRRVFRLPGLRYVNMNEFKADCEAPSDFDIYRIPAWAWERYEKRRFELARDVFKALGESVDMDQVPPGYLSIPDAIKRARDMGANWGVSTVQQNASRGAWKKVKAQWRQLCVLHAVKRLGYILWRGRMSLEERREALEAMKEPLYTLVNSAEKHLEDGDMERLRWRIDWTLRMLHDAALGLKSRGYRKASEYLEKHAGLLVTFAELALEGVEVPYTSNRVERLMGEVAKRCKNRWMHWGTEGLRSILIFVLVRYTDEEVYERFKKAYIHNEAFLC